jgi:hypothetical protein
LALVALPQYLIAQAIVASNRHGTAAHGRGQHVPTISVSQAGLGLMRAGCSIVSPNYHPFARTLCDSFRAQHPDLQFFVLIVADLPLQNKAVFQGYGYTPVLLGEIGLHDLRSDAMKYDILELNTNVKPTFLKFLFAEHEVDELVYLDPDIFVYSPLSPVFEALKNASAVLTPHLTSPVNDGKKPGEQEMLYNGTYNLGFIALRRSAETTLLLNWWEERCLALAFSEGRTGLFVDQKWMNLAPGLFDGVNLLRHPGCNMAFWNLHERRLQETNTGYRLCDGRDLCFFHFSGVILTDPESLSRNTDRYTLAQRPDLRALFDAYKRCVLANRVEGIDNLPYGFDRLSDGTAVTRLARRIYAAHCGRWPGQDPFDASKDFAVFARRLGLVAGRTAPQKSTWREFDPEDRRVKLLHRTLKIGLRLLGPNRYELLMRYLGHITVLRHQSVFLS